MPDDDVLAYVAQLDDAAEPPGTSELVLALKMLCPGLTTQHSTRCCAMSTTPCSSVWDVASSCLTALARPGS